MHFHEYENILYDKYLHVIIAIYGPMIYTIPHNAFDAGKIHYEGMQVGGG